MQLPADTHAHIYKNYNLSAYFRAAFRNFRKCQSSGGTIAGFLFLTQSAANSYELKELTANKIPGFALSKEGELLRVENEENLRIYLVPGRQFVSREKLEILALAYAGPELDGRESREILHELFEKKACAVLPWSPGKWAGKRGALIKSLIEQRERFNFLLGDIAMRSFYEPRVFQTAKNYGIGILAGSDSLPLSGEEEKAGSYCSLVELPDEFNPTLKDSAMMLNSAALPLSGSRDTFFQAFGRWGRLNFARSGLN